MAALPASADGRSWEGWLYRSAVCLDQCWILDNYSADGAKTPIGQSVYESKYQNDSAATETITGWMRLCLASLPPRAQLGWRPIVIPVPPNPTEPVRALLRAVGGVVASWVTGEYSENVVTRKRPRPKTKQVPPGQLPLDGLQASDLRVSDDIHGRDVVIVDDVIRTGHTIGSVAMALTQANARRVTAVVAANAPRGLSVETNR